MKRKSWFSVGDEVRCVAEMNGDERDIFIAKCWSATDAEQIVLAHRESERDQLREIKRMLEKEGERK